jgi:chorismate mutase
MGKMNLDTLRKSLDNIDAALIILLAERFKITQEVAWYKKENNLPAIDETREEHVINIAKEFAEKSGLEPAIAEKFLRLIIDEAVVNHKKILSD